MTGAFDGSEVTGCLVGFDVGRFVDCNIADESTGMDTFSSSSFSFDC